MAYAYAAGGVAGSGLGAGEGVGDLWQAAPIDQQRFASFLSFRGGREAMVDHTTGIGAGLKRKSVMFEG
jgi:hypothetical protein